MPRNRVECSSVKFFPVLGAAAFRPSRAFNGLAEFQSLLQLKGAAAFIKNNFTAHYVTGASELLVKFVELDL